jgi:DNA polymerase III sliding clamp (beta) subunit (PCNA family)
MKFSAQASALKTAIDLAAAACDPRHKVAVFGHLHLFADREHVTVRANTADHVLDAVVPAQVESVGEVVVPGQRLAALVSGFASGETVTTADTGAITCARSRYRLPVVDSRGLPPVRSLDQVLGEVELFGADALRLFSLPLPYCGTEQTRYSLNGIYVADHADGLLAAATDGVRLLQLKIAAKGSLSQDRRLVIPSKACALIVKLLRRRSETVTLRRSRTSFEISAPEFRLVTALIDCDFPSFERLFPQEPPASTAIVAHAELAAALSRLKAVLDPAVAGTPAVGIQWATGGGAVELTLPRQPDCASELIDAETTGACRVAANLEFLAEIDVGKRIRFGQGADRLRPGGHGHGRARGLLWCTQPSLCAADNAQRLMVGKPAPLGAALRRPIEEEDPGLQHSGEADRRAPGISVPAI